MLYFLPLFSTKGPKQFSSSRRCSVIVSYRLGLKKREALQSILVPTAKARGSQSTRQPHHVRIRTELHEAHISHMFYI
ncbi:hypothetical protein Hanom_Chr08g00716811 [Helianthus anomalus]